MYVNEMNTHDYIQMYKKNIVDINKQHPEAYLGFKYEYYPTFRNIQNPIRIPIYPIS